MSRTAIIIYWFFIGGIVGYILGASHDDGPHGGAGGTAIVSGTHSIAIGGKGGDCGR